MPSGRKVSIRVADGGRMPGLFGDIVLSMDGVDFSRISSRAGVKILADHLPDLPLGTVDRGYVREGSVWMDGELVDTNRNVGHMEELDNGLRSGASPGFIMNSVRLEEDANDELFLYVASWTPYEVSSTPIPRNPDAAFVTIAPRKRGSSSVSQAQKPVTPSAVPTQARASATDTRDAKLTASIEEYARKAVAKIMARPTRTIYPKSRGPDAVQADVSPPVRPSDGVPASALAHVIQAAYKGTHDLPHGAEVIASARQGSQVRVPTSKAMEQAVVITTAGVSGAKTTEAIAGVPGQQPDAGSAERILSLPRVLTNVPNDITVPVIDGLATAAMVAEGAAIAEAGPTFVSGRGKLTPHVVATRLDVNLETVVQGGPLLEALLEGELRRAARSMVASQMLTGSGAAPNIRGVQNVTGIGASTYATADFGKPAGFQETEKHIEDSDADGRLTWILSKSLWSKARTTVRGTGSVYVLERGFVLSDVPAIRSGLLADGVGLVGVWSDSLLVWHADSLLVMDKISEPGQLRLTLLTWFSYSVDRATSFAQLSET